jgi:hypothetical protein
MTRRARTERCELVWRSERGPWRAKRLVRLIADTTANQRHNVQFSRIRPDGNEAADESALGLVVMAKHGGVQ